MMMILEVVLGSLALAFIVSAYWHRPLGPSLAMANPIHNPEQYSPSTILADQQAIEVLPEPTQTPETLLSRIKGLLNNPNPAPKTLCGAPAAMTILLVGSDERGNDYLYGLADSIRLVRIDFSVPSAMVVDIPRDLWVDIPGISDHYGITQGKLNQAYFFGNPGMGYYDGPGEGPGLLARTLEQNYGVQVDHYLAVDRATFVNIINSLGGIDIQLDSRVDMNEAQDGANPDYVLEPGLHHLEGDMALRFAANRFPSIFQRARYQNIVLKSLQARLFNLSMIPELPNLVSQFAGSVQTDLSPNEISQLICVGKELTPENTHMVAFPDEMFVSGSTYDPYRQVNTFTLSVDLEQFRGYFEDFMQGSWPTN